MIINLKQKIQGFDFHKLFVRHGEIVIFIFFIISTMVISFLNPVFLNPLNLTNLMRQAAALGMIAIGQMIVILVNGIDLSVGMIASISGVMTAVIIGGQQELALPAIIAGLLIGVFIGFLNGFIITKFNLPEFIVTLAIASFFNGLLLVYTGGREVGKISPGLMAFGLKNVLIFPTSFIICIIFIIVTYIFLRYTRIGRHMYAVGGNKVSARLSGINVNLTKTVAYMISGFTAAAGGLILLTRLGVGYPLAGRELQLDSVVAVVIGGTSLKGGRGSILGAFAGAIVLSQINNVLNLFRINPYTQVAFKGLIIILVVVLRAFSERD